MHVEATTAWGVAVSAASQRAAAEHSQHGLKVAVAAANVARAQHLSAVRAANTARLTAATTTALHGRATAAEHARDAAHATILCMESKQHTALLSMRADLLAAQEHARAKGGQLEAALRRLV